MTEVIIDRRFRGPPNSGNGGYVCGILARHIGPSAEVTLRKPPPLDVPLRVVGGEDGKVELRDGEVVVASGRPIDLRIAPSPTASFAEAEAAAARTPYDEASHALPMCFVCGPARIKGDGLRIFAGPLTSDHAGTCVPFASHWVPDDSLAARDGLVGEEFVWAALDCPTGYAVGGPDSTQAILLGRLAANIVRRPRPGEKCVVTAQATASDGRKLFAAGTLFGEGGDVLALAHATWISVDRDVQLGKRV